MVIGRESRRPEPGFVDHGQPRRNWSQGMEPSVFIVPRNVRWHGFPDFVQVRLFANSPSMRAIATVQKRGTRDDLRPDSRAFRGGAGLHLRRAGGLPLVRFAYHSRIPLNLNSFFDKC